MTFNTEFTNKKNTWKPWKSQEDDATYDYGFEVVKPKQEETAWEYYKRTGKWRGHEFHQKSLVDYGYIEKMANMFAAKFNITVKAGKDWAAIPEDKTLIYEPTSLMQYPKGRIIALLLHEIGHIRYTDTPTDNASPYITKYNKSAREVFNVFEDFRIDKIMIKAYPGAEDAYEANKPVIREMAMMYENRSQRIRDMVVQLVNYYTEISRPKETDEKEWEKTERERLGKIKEFQKLKKENLMDYLGAIFCIGYGEPVKINSQRIADYVKRTEGAIKKTEKSDYSAMVVNILDKEVYPVIEDLMKELQEPQKEIEDAFGKEVAKKVAEELIRFINGGQMSQGDREAQHGSQKSLRLPGAMRASNSRIPKEWADGDYKSLRDSVDTPIKELIRKLTFLKKEEETVRYQNQQKRGKLHTKSLYRHGVADYRLFKKKLENTDTVRSFAFTLLLDRSGSMAGQRIIHSTRALIMLAEVFEKMKIPYEIKMFGDNVYGIKKFGDVLDDKAKKRIGGIVKSADGGTNLYPVFQKGTDLENQPQKNKVMVIISDGDIGGGVDRVQADYMNKYKDEKHFKFIGVGLECDDEIIKLCYGNGFVADDVGTLPDLFSDMLKKVIFKQK